MIEDRRKLGIRLAVIQYATTVVFGALALSFWYLQIVQNAQFEELAENNHQRTLALRAPRGVLLDRAGRVLVENRDAYNISIVREHPKTLDRTIRLLAGVIGMKEAEIRDIVARHRREPVYRPVVIVEDATLAQVAAVTARRLDFELPDVVVERVPTRRYPTNALAAHLFGYVGEVSDAQIEEAKVESGAIVGQSGIEKVYNRHLMGEDGARRVVVNSVGREIRTLEEIAPSEGRRVQLTIDYDLQRATEEAFRHYGYWGAAAFLDPRTGEVLSLTSLPAYDPNDFATGIDRGTWTSLNADQLKPLQNRVIQGRYSPGSTFKIVVATAALEEKVAGPDFRVTCGGGGTFYGRYFRCHLAGGHGTVNMRQALERSCNTYFYTVGNLVGIDRLHKWATLLGLGRKSGIDLPNEVEGIMPSTEWKREKTGERWYAGETISVAIGQGQVSVTPISLAVMMATVANGGTRVVPRLVKAVDNGQGWEPVPAAAAESHRFRPETLATLHDGLWMVVNAQGTGGRGRIPGRNVAGKTGTAQVISLQGGRQAAGRTDKDLRDHGWFVFFAPRDNPEIAGVVLAEHSEHGYLAAPIARHVMETYFAKQDRQALPALPRQEPAGAPVALAAAAPEPPPADHP